MERKSVRHWARGAVILFKRGFQTFSSHSVVHTKRWALCTAHWSQKERSVSLRKYHKCVETEPPPPPTQSNMRELMVWGEGGVYFLDDVLSWPFSVLFEMTLNILDIAPPSPLSDIIMLKLEIETCSKASAPSGSAGEASGCTDSMAWSERFNHLILLSVLMPTSDFSVRRCESSACIQTHWRCDQLPGNTVNEWHVHLKCVEAGGRIYLAVVETSP